MDAMFIITNALSFLLIVDLLNKDDETDLK